MPPAAAKDVFVILFDLKVESRPSALKLLSEVLLYEQLSQSKSLHKLYLVNSANTSNNLNREGVCKLDASVEVDTLFKEISAVETGKSDWVEAVEVALEDIREFADQPGIVTLQVLFITDLSSFEKPSNQKLLNELIKNLAIFDAFLYVAGPSVHPPTTILSYKDIKLWMETLEVDEKNANLNMLKILIQKTPHSVICSYDMGLHLFYSYKYQKGMQPWLVPLTIGTVLHMPVSTLRLSKREPPFKLQNNFPYERSNKWAYEDEQDKIVDECDTVSGLIRHGKFVKIQSDGLFKIEGPRCFEALMFTKAENVPEYLCQSDGSYLVIPDKGSEEYKTFFNALIDEMAKSNTYLIAKRVYNKDFTPKIEVLIPRPDFNVKCFLMCELPYSDDIAHEYTEQDIDSAPAVEPNKMISDFLDSISVGTKNCQINVPLGPTMMVYGSAPAIISKVEEKLLKDWFMETKMDKARFNDATCFKNLKNNWPVREIEIKKEEKEAADFDDVDDFDFS